MWVVLTGGLAVGAPRGAVVGAVFGFVAAAMGFRISGQECGTGYAGPCGNAIGLAALVFGSMPGVVIGGLVGGIGA
ncbi:hypothetical protein GCM10009416_48210 [Craurococcus roseus]|uniref:Uncharacterized protein n=1 Tax=Craurococcus roseus TaxID=77585 RepID=A0ABP3R8X2_9PROT